MVSQFVIVPICLGFQFYWSELCPNCTVLFCFVPITLSHFHWIRSLGLQSTKFGLFTNSDKITNCEGELFRWFCGRNLWSMPCRGILSQITLKTRSLYMGKYPCTLWTWIWEVEFVSILALLEWYTHMCVCIWIIMNKKEVQGNPREGLEWQWQHGLGIMSVRTPLHSWHKSEKLCFQSSPIATVTNCDISENSTVAICDQCHVVGNWVQSH